MKKKLMLALGVSCLFVLAGLAYSSNAKAYAVSMCGVLAPATTAPPPNTNCLNGQNYNALTNLNSSNLKTSFISTLNNYLNNGQEPQQVGAQFIIDQLCASGCGGESWDDRINDSDIRLIQGNFSFGTNTGYDPYSNSVVTYADSDTRYSLIFQAYENGSWVDVYAIKEDCGNPVGSMPGLPKPSVPPTLDGVKIDNNAAGDFGGNYDAVTSGETDTGVYTFSDDTVAIYTTGGALVTSDTANPFYFTSGVDAGTYSLRLSDSGAADDGWQLIGFKICDSNNPPSGGCDNSYLTDLSSGVHGNGGQVTLDGGGAYHMRWIFKQKPFSVDGVKIADNGTGPSGTTTGYGGTCYSATYSLTCGNGALASYPFSDDTVSISTGSCNGGVTTTTDNPFWFTNCNSSGADSAMTYYTVSVAESGRPDTGWRLYGYSICMNGGACNSGYLTSTDNITQAASFDYPFLGGHTYHIRFIYEQVPTGSLSVTCNSGTGLADASANFSDPDGVTTATVTYGSTTTSAANSSSASWNSLSGTDWRGASYTLSVVDIAHDGTVIAIDSVATASTPPCRVLTCGSFTSQGMEADSTFTMKVFIGYIAGGPPPTSSPAYGMNAQVSGPAPTAYYSAVYNPNDTSGVPPPGAVAPFPTGYASLAFTDTPPVAGQYTVSWNMLVDGSTISPPSPCGGAGGGGGFTAYNLPYFKAYGNDVMAGGAFDAGGCSNNSTAVGDTGYPGSISAFNNDSYTGAGSQLAAYAIGHIRSFSSAAMRLAIGSPGPVPKGLSFANTNGFYGGDFGGSNCIHNWAKDQAKGSVTATVSGTVDPALLNGAYKATSNITLNASGPIASGSGTAGNRSIIYVNNADVEISGNGIAFQDGTGSRVQLADIPSFWLVVDGGDIFIDPGVKQLDGVYVAQPKPDGTKGEVFTCSDLNGTSGSGFAPHNLHDPDYINHCGTQLTINGAFIANKVDLLRSFSSARYADGAEFPYGSNVNCSKPTCAAEVFNFTPEVLLALPNGQGSAATGNYDAITELPPVL